MKLFDKAVKRSKLYRNLVRDFSNAERRANELANENAVLSERVAEISRKMVNVTVQRHDKQSFPIMRVVCDIDTMALQMGLMHGNDSSVIELMGREIGYRAAHQIRQCNFQRWEK